MANQKKTAILALQITLAILIFSPIAHAATIHGFVYDIFLDELDKAIITINTEPQQKTVSKDGEYSFTVPKGDYIIKATYKSEDGSHETEEAITIIDDGDYIIDLILIPTFEDEFLNESLIELEEFEDIDKKTFSTTGAIIAIIAMLLILLYFYFTKSHFIKETEIKSETEEELEKIIKFIKEKGGRVTQKEIRKKFPSSEAKISLIITELESKKIVKKIKKGRGNVIILTKEGSKK